MPPHPRKRREARMTRSRLSCEKDADAGVAQPADLAPEQPAPQRVDAICRLVEDHDWRPARLPSWRSRQAAGCPRQLRAERPNRPESLASLLAPRRPFRWSSRPLRRNSPRPLPDKRSRRIVWPRSSFHIDVSRRCSSVSRWGLSWDQTWLYEARSGLSYHRVDSTKSPGFAGRKPPAGARGPLLHTQAVAGSKTRAMPRRPPCRKARATLMRQPPRPLGTETHVSAQIGEKRRNLRISGRCEPIARTHRCFRGLSGC